MWTAAVQERGVFRVEPSLLQRLPRCFIDTFSVGSPHFNSHIQKVDGVLSVKQLGLNDTNS